FAFIALLHAAFMPSEYSWLWASLIVTVVYLVIGGICGGIAYSRIKQTSLKPTRTLEVLKQDQVWIQNESRAA
ncbi:MAG TPA: phage holin family protein, partial [Candidatus Angelobacter sp.]|nr:phage holin family protein [Candidatus Angelobacter sp.]